MRARHVASLLLILGWSVAAAAVDIDTCGQTVRSDQTGELTIDLTCADGPAVLLDVHGRLDLMGRTITVEGEGPAVYCAGGDCAVFSSTAGPAAIVVEGVEAASDGVLADVDRDDERLRRLVVENVGITGGESGIRAPEATLTLAAVTVAGARGPGIVARDLDGFNLTVTGNGDDGVRAESVRLACATVTGNGGLDVASAEAPALGEHVTCCGVSPDP